MKPIIVFGVMYVVGWSIAGLILLYFMASSNIKSEVFIFEIYKELLKK